jgi:hypothetical protein
MTSGAPGVGVAAVGVGVPVGAAEGEGLPEADGLGEASGVAVLRPAEPADPVGEGEGLTAPDRPGRLQPPSASTPTAISGNAKWRSKAPTG